MVKPEYCHVKKVNMYDKLIGNQVIISIRVHYINYY